MTTTVRWLMELSKTVSNCQQLHLASYEEQGTGKKAIVLLTSVKLFVCFEDNDGQGLIFHNPVRDGWASQRFESTQKCHVQTPDWHHHGTLYAGRVDPSHATDVRASDWGYATAHKATTSQDLTVPSLIQKLCPVWITQWPAVQNEPWFWMSWLMSTDGN